MNNLLPYLKTKSPSGESKTFRLTQTKYTIGRVPENDIALPEEDGVISRIEHCCLEKKNGQWHLTDNSTNGTIVQHEQEQFQLQDLPNQEYIIDTEDKIIIHNWELEYIDPHKTNSVVMNIPKTPFVFNVSESRLYGIKQGIRHNIYLTENQEKTMVFMANQKLAQGKDHICNYKELNKAIWNHDNATNHQGLMDTIQEIRDIFEKNKGKREGIVNRRGRGYFLTIDCEP